MRLHTQCEWKTNKMWTCTFVVAPSHAAFPPIARFNFCCVCWFCLFVGLATWRVSHACHWALRIFGALSAPVVDWCMVHNLPININDCVSKLSFGQVMRASMAHDQCECMDWLELLSRKLHRRLSAAADVGAPQPLRTDMGVEHLNIIDYALTSSAHLNTCYVKRNSGYHEFVCIYTRTYTYAARIESCVPLKYSTDNIAQRINHSTSQFVANGQFVRLSHWIKCARAHARS